MKRRGFIESVFKTAPLIFIPKVITPYWGKVRELNGINVFDAGIIHNTASEALVFNPDIVICQFSTDNGKTWKPVCLTTDNNIEWQYADVNSKEFKGTLCQ